MPVSKKLRNDIEKLLWKIFSRPNQEFSIPKELQQHLYNVTIQEGFAICQKKYGRGMTREEFEEGVHEFFVELPLAFRRFDIATSLIRYIVVSAATQSRNFCVDEFKKKQKSLAIMRSKRNFANCKCSIFLMDKIHRIKAYVKDNREIFSVNLTLCILELHELGVFPIKEVQCFGGDEQQTRREIFLECSKADGGCPFSSLCKQKKKDDGSCEYSYEEIVREWRNSRKIISSKFGE